MPDRPDARDALLLPEAAPTTALTSLDLSTDPANPPIWDQADLGSCTAHGTGRCYSFAAAKHLGGTPVTPSRLFIYYFERWLEGTTRSDSGASIRDGFKVLTTMGAPPEFAWPYDTSKFKTKPSGVARTTALAHKVLKYERLAAGCPSVTHLKNSLALLFPVTFGFTVYDSFQNIGSDGIMPMPAPGEGVLGGHCVAAVGFDDAAQRVKCANSWGADWGDNGYFYMPYSYYTPSFCSDFWQAKVAD